MLEVLSYMQVASAFTTNQILIQANSLIGKGIELNMNNDLINSCESIDSFFILCLLILCEDQYLPVLTEMHL